MMYDIPATREQLDRTIAALKTNGIEAVVAADGADANAKALALIPLGANVMTMTSVTLDTLGIVQELNESGKYDSVRVKLASMDRKTQGREMGVLMAAPDYTIGSVHAVTEDGHVMIASGTGSQLSAYVFGAAHVIWVVGTQKIVKNLDEGAKRIYEYTLPLESVRFNKAYNMTSGSAVNKLLIVNKERPDRITVIFVPENIGF